MSDPDIKSRFTPHILDITKSLARLDEEGEDFRAEPIAAGERIFEARADELPGSMLRQVEFDDTVDEPDEQPPAGDAKLLRHIAGAIHSTLYGPRGDDTTRKLATTAAHAVLSVRDLEVVELRRSLTISRKRTAHFAALYSEALDALEDIAP